MTKASSKTKQRILQTARELLNAKGVSNVKMRDVSGSLNMSIGNLTYHYPKWENLMDDLFAEFERAMDDLYLFFPKDISEVVLYIDRIYDIQMHYAFIFSDFYIFFKLYPKYQGLKNDFFSQRMKTMREALQRLIEKGYLYPESDRHNYDLLVKNTWLLLSGWYGFSMMLKESKYAYTKDEFFFSIWNLYVYHLSSSGKALVRKSYEALKSTE